MDTPFVETLLVLPEARFARIDSRDSHESGLICANRLAGSLPTYPPFANHVSGHWKSEEVLASQGRVSGSPEKGADLRGSSGNLRGSPGNFRGSLGNFRGTPRLLLSSTERTSREVAEKLPGKFGELPGKSGDFPEARGSPTPSQRLAKFVSKKIVRSEKLQNESSPNFFRIFVPNFLPNFAPNFPRIFWGVFVLRFPGNGDHKKFTKNPRPFSMQNSQADTKKKFTKCFWRAGKVKNCKSQIWGDSRESLGRYENRGFTCENFCPLQGSFGPFGPKVANRVRKWVPGPFQPRGPKSPKQSRKRVKIVEK